MGRREEGEENGEKEEAVGRYGERKLTGYRSGGDV